MKFTKEKGITLIALVITIIVLIILASVSLYLLLANNGILIKTQEAKEENQKQTATEMMNFKITNIQISSYAENNDLPSLQYLADKLCEDNDIEYVLKQSKAHASLDKIDVTDVSSIYTKLKNYPYEFEIDSALRLASVDGVKLSIDNNTITNYSKEEQVVGTWMDGKPIYRKSFEITVNNNSNYTFNAKEIISEDIDIILNTYGYSLVDNGNTCANFPCYYTSTAYLGSWADVTTKIVHIVSGTKYASATHYLTVEYTKTTDSPI